MLELLGSKGSTATLTALDGSEKVTVVSLSTSVLQLGGKYLYRASSKQESVELQGLLEDDARIDGVYRPPAYRVTRDAEMVARSLSLVGDADDTPLTDDERALIAQASAVNQWGLERCGFRDAWAQLPFVRDPGRIVMIDNGRRLNHPELQGVVEYNGPGWNNQASIADHASSVAAIMSARRDPKKRPGANDMDGCCQASIDLFNIWTKNHGVDHAVLYNALQRAIDVGSPVVNMSIWLEETDKHLESLLKQAAEKDIVVVAAIGNVGQATAFYPATDPNVIAVAGTDSADRPYVDSITGPQAFIAAPAEEILTVVGDSGYDRLTGTSYAAPFVSAAVWLAKGAAPKPLTNLQVRWLLANSVAKRQLRNDRVGYGRLDMRQLVIQLRNVPDSPDECAAFFGEALAAV
jgi:hypothetical protein